MASTFRVTTKGFLFIKFGVTAPAAEQCTEAYAFDIRLRATERVQERQCDFPNCLYPYHRTRAGQRTIRVTNDREAIWTS